MKKTLFTILATLIIISNIGPDTIHSINEIRNPLGIVTWSTGIVVDDDGAGTATTPFTDSYYNYIGYDADTTEPGQKVFTVFIYNPFTLYHDDIIARFDF